MLFVDGDPVLASHTDGSYHLITNFDFNLIELIDQIYV